MTAIMDALHGNTQHKRDGYKDDNEISLTLQISEMCLLSISLFLNGRSTMNKA